MNKFTARPTFSHELLDASGRPLHEWVERMGYTVDIVRSPGTAFPHRHVGLEIVFVHTGTTVWRVGDYLTVLLPGDLLLFDATSSHSSRPVQGDYIRSTIHMMPDIVDFTAQLPFYAMERPKKISLSASVAEDVFQSIKQLRATHHDGGRLHDARSVFESMFAHIASVLDRRDQIHDEINSEINDSINHPVIGDVLRYMMEKADGSETIENLALKFFVSERHLYHLFRKLLHCTPQKLLQFIKIEQCCALMLHDDHSVDTLAKVCGFGSRRGFQRAFKRVTGMSPETFRKIATSQFWS